MLVFEAFKGADSILEAPAKLPGFQLFLLRMAIQCTFRNAEVICGVGMGEPWLSPLAGGRIYGPQPERCAAAKTSGTLEI